MQQDRFGNAITTSSAQAAQHYIDALDHLFCMRNAAQSEIEQALAFDPEFALAHCVLARVHFFAGDGQAARKSAEQAVALAGHASSREQQHADIVLRVTRNESEGVLAMVRDHAQQYPRDALPLSFALGVYSLLGFGGFTDHHQLQVDLLESVAPAWPEDWWMQSWLGWSYAEAGQVARGTELLDASLVTRPDNANTAHGRAHAFYEAGQCEQGQRFLHDWIPCYEKDEPLHCHVVWHLALLYLQQGDFDTAHDLYTQFVRPSVSLALPMFTHIDCAAFSWRSRLYGRPLASNLMQEIQTFAEQHFAKPGLPFVNWHTQLINAQTSANATSTFADDVHQQAGQAGGLMFSSSDDLCASLVGFANGNYAQAAKKLRQALPNSPAIGGSNAQRDAITDGLVACLAYAGDQETAQQVAQQRADLRASHMNEQWFGRLRGGAN